MNGRTVKGPGKPRPGRRSVTVGFARHAVRWYGPCVRALLAVVVLVLAALALEVLITLVAKT